MKSYFILQFKLQTRKFQDIGISPILGVILVAIGFFFITEFLYSKSQFASFILGILALSICFKFAEMKRSEFIQLNFGNSLFVKIRMIENGTVCLPFIVVLLFHQVFVGALILFLSALLVVFYRQKISSFGTTPTPFSSNPFEFSVGFRATRWIIFACYLLLCFAIYYSNFNLGIFTILLIYSICMSYYWKIEDPFFVWIFAQTTAQFLGTKMRIGFQYSGLLVLPLVVTMCCFFPTKIGLIMGFTAIGMLIFINGILAKYAVFPAQLNVGDVILVVSSVFFPPLLILIFPYYYMKSIQNLTSILK